MALGAEVTWDQLLFSSTTVSVGASKESADDLYIALGLADAPATIAFPYPVDTVTFAYRTHLDYSEGMTVRVQNTDPPVDLVLPSATAKQTVTLTFDAPVTWIGFEHVAGGTPEPAYMLAIGIDDITYGGPECPLQ